MILKDFLIDSANNMSAMNLFLKEGLTENDYYYYTINDNNKYRIDLIANAVGLNRYPFFIMMLNPIKTLDDIKTGRMLKIPTNAYIQKYESRLRQEVLPK